MVENFKINTDKLSSDKETLSAIKGLLELHGYETPDLIHQYYLERLRQQHAMSETTFGHLTVNCLFKGQVLEVRCFFEILNNSQTWCNVIKDLLIKFI